MADYKISLGAEVRTKEIDKQLSNYNGSVKVTADASSIKSDIDTVINGYKSPNKIKIGATLVTQDITDKIKDLNKEANRKNLKVKIKPDFTGFDKAVKEFSTRSIAKGAKSDAKPFKIKAELNFAGIAGQIKDFINSAEGQAQKIQLKAELSDGAVSEAVREFNAAISKAESNAAKIQIGVDPDFTGVEQKIGGWQISTPLNVKVKVLKKELIEDLKTFQNKDTHNFIFLKARLIDNAVQNALDGYKQRFPDRVKFPVDLQLGDATEITNKLNEYKEKGIEVPVTLKPAEKGFKDKISKVYANVEATLTNPKEISETINSYVPNPILVNAKLIPAQKNFTSEITKTPIQIQAELAPNAINDAIVNAPKNLSKLPIGVTIKPPSKDNDINAQIKQLALAVAPLEVDAKLNDEKINANIGSIRPTTPLSVNVKLLDDDINKQIEAIHPTSPINVNIKVNDGEIDEKTGVQKTQEPIFVDVDINRDDINTQIRDFKPTAKVNVGVNLDFKTHKDKDDPKKIIQRGVAQQIKDYETKTKVKVGVELDKDSVNTTVQNFKADVPIKLDVELNTEPAEKRIEELKEEFKKFGNININFNNPSDNPSDASGASSGGSGSGSGLIPPKNTVSQFREIDFTLNSMGNHVDEFKKGLKNIGVNDGSIDKIVKDFESLEVSIRKVTSRIDKDGNLRLTVKGVDQDGRAVTSMKKIVGSGKDATVIDYGTSVAQTFDQTAEAFEKLKSLGKEIGQLDIKIAGLDVDKNKQEIAELIAQLNILEAEYNDLFDITEKNLNASQIDELVQDIVNGSNKLAATKAKVTDKSDAKKAQEEVKETERAFNKLKSLGKEISDIDIKIAGLDTDKNKQEIEALISILNRLEAEYNDLFDATEKRLTSGQIDELVQDVANGSERIDVVKGKVADKANAKRAQEEAKAEAKEINDAYNQIYNTRKRIGSLEVDLIGAEAKGDLKAVKDINDEIARLKSNLATLEQNNIGEKFTDEQKSELRELRKQSQYNKRQAQNSADYKAGVQAEKDEARRVNDAYNQIYNIQKKIGSLEVDLINAEDTKDAQILRTEIERLQNELLELDKNNVSSKFSENQKKSLEELKNQIDFNKKQAENKVDIKLESQIDKEEAAKINEVFEKVKKTKEEIGKLEVELIGEKAKGDIETFDAIIERLTECKNKLLELNALTSNDGETYSSKFSDEQKGKLDEIDLEYEYKKKHASSQIADKTALKETENAFKRLKELGKEISQLDIEIAKLDPDKDIAEIDKLTARLKKLEAEYDSLFDSTETNLTGGQIDELLRDIENGGDKLDILKAKLKDAKTALATKIDINLNDGTVAKQVKNVTSEFDKIKNKLPELQIAMDGFNEALAKLNIAKDYEGEDRVEKLIAAYQEYERALKAVKNQLDINKTAEKDAAAKAKLEDDRLAFQSKIDAWLTKNSAAAKLFGDDLLELRKQAESCDRVKLDHLEREFKRIDTEAEAAGKKMKTFPDRIKEQFQKYSSYFSIASVFMYAEQAMRSMFEQVKLIDSAMTELKKVTNETDASYNNFLGNAASRAKELGTTIDGLVASTADFARLGYGFQESQKLAEVANIYAVVGDEIEGVEDATQSLVSTMAAFKNDMNGLSNDEFAMSIVDKMNEVSNNFAISSGGIGQALQRSASSMAAANNTLDETIAMITAANEVAQNPEKVGNAMKTMSMRIRGAKTELEEAGESTDGMAESTASLRAEIKALSGVDIMLDANTFKSTYQIMDELSRKWENLSDIQQATIIELVAGRVFARIYRNVYKEYI